MMNFNQWWHELGSGITPLPDEDMEGHAKRIAEIAWRNGMLYAASVAESLYRHETPNGFFYATGDTTLSDLPRAIRQSAREMD